jgi:putative transposase
MYYQRNLPHIQPTEAVFFITARLAGSLPVSVVNQLKEESERALQRLAETSDDVDALDKAKLDYQKRYFVRFDSCLDNPQNGPYWLSNPQVATVLKEALHFRAKDQYDLVAYTIMSNHIHFVVDTRAKGSLERPLFRIIQSFKSHTARQSNTILNRNGEFWHSESYDHVVRDQSELQRVIQYVLNNPVRAGLVQEWQAWSSSYVNEAYL